jgi:23S rRNA pseudouridine1911/1915/1917 synthase
MPSSTGWLTDWLPAAFNDGHAYRDRVSAAAASTAGFYAKRYTHSDPGVWRERLAAGQIWRNGQRLWGDGPLVAGDRLVWHRPPWQEAAVPVLPGPLFDDGDLVVFNKPSGLPVLPAGGFLQYTVLGQLARVAPGARPVHRLGRFTSGLLVCARSRQARAWLSAQLRDSTAASVSATGSGSGPQKVYRALLSLPQPGSALLQLAVGQALPLDTPIGRQPHGRLGSLWCAAAPGDDAPLPARSQLTLLEPRADGWLVQVAIATGRPHQIRIHVAAAGAPLLGDPLYLPGGVARAEALPGDGGYQLHAHRLSLSPPDGRGFSLEAPLPPLLQSALKSDSEG